jgi:hypothetical protein
MLATRNRIAFAAVVAVLMTGRAATADRDLSHGALEPDGRLASLAAVRDADPDVLDALTSVRDVSCRIYACWRLGLSAGEREHIKVVLRKSASPGSVQRTAGFWSESRDAPAQGDGAR